MASRFLTGEDEEETSPYLEQMAATQIPNADAITWESKLQDRSQGQGLSMDAGFQGLKNTPSAMKESGGVKFRGFKTSPSIIDSVGGVEFQGFKTSPTVDEEEVDQPDDMFSSWQKNNKRRAPVRF